MTSKTKAKTLPETAEEIMRESFAESIIRFNNTIEHQLSEYNMDIAHQIIESQVDDIFFGDWVNELRTRYGRYPRAIRQGEMHQGDTHQ